MLASGFQTSHHQRGLFLVQRTPFALFLLLAIPATLVAQESQKERESDNLGLLIRELHPTASASPHAPPAFIKAQSNGYTESNWLTLADLQAMAFQRNPTLALAAARMNMARGRQFQAGRYPNPVAGYHAMQIGNLGTAGQQGGFLSQRFITAGKRRLDQQIAGKEVEEAQFRFYAQEQRVLSDLHIHFYDAQVAHRRVELTTELARIGDQLVESTERLLGGRQVTRNDLLQAEIRANESYILLDNAINQRTEAWRRLTAVVGEPNMQMTPLVGDLDADFPEYNWDDCYAMVLTGNPLLSEARTRVARARIVIKRARKEPIPNIDLSVSNRYSSITHDNVTNIQAGIPIPIFDKNRGNIRSAEAALISACNDVKRIELDLQDRLAVAYRRYANALRQAARYRDQIIPRAKQSLGLVTEGYRKGQVEYLTLLNAQETYSRVNLSYLDSLNELRRSSSIIEGQLLANSLDNPS